MALINLNEIEYREILHGLKVKFVHSENMTLAYWDFMEGDFLPGHSHPNEQICTVIEGTLELKVDGKAYHMQPGFVFTIPPDVLHSGKALTKCKVIDAFYPVRDDYK